jgi:Cd2+/Zn2+-exporting ATPase
MTDAPFRKTRFQVGGMDCAACSSKIETAVSRIPGVTEVTSSFTSGAMSVGHTGEVPRVAIERAVKNLGYSIALAAGKPMPATGREAHSDHDGHEHDHEHDDGPTEHFDLGDGPWWKSRKAILVAGGGTALLAAHLVGLAFPVVGHWAFLAALLVGLIPIGRRAIAGALAGSPFTIETLMTIAAVGAVIIGATEEAATVVLLLLVGELLEGVAAGRARASIRGLTALVPKTALLEDNGQIREVPAESLAVGSVIAVRPGDRVPADGEIVEGSSSIDESPVSGESVPTRKSVRDVVFAGTINADAVLRVGSLPRRRTTPSRAS